MSSLKRIFKLFRDLKALSFTVTTGKRQEGQKS